jgi:hypothetical protein
MRYPPDEDDDRGGEGNDVRRIGPAQDPGYPRPGAYPPPGQHPPGQHSPGQYASGQYASGPPGPFGPPSQPAEQGAPGAYQQPGSSGRPRHGERRYGQPAYGQPPYPSYGDSGGYADHGWGGPPQPAHGRRRRRRPRLLLSFSALVFLILAIVVVPTLTGRTALDPQTVQRDVAGQFEEQQGVSVDLRCADRMTVDPGRHYQCAGTTSEGEPVTITITITDRNANYTWAEG